MKILLPILSLAGLLLLMSGCSVFIASQGKDLETVFAQKSTRQSVERELGPPDRFVKYEQARRLSEIPEIHAFPSSTHPAESKNLAASYGDYRYKGRVFDLGASQSAGMVFGITFGLGELWAFPKSLGDAAVERKKEHFFRVWYSENGQCIAYVWRPAEKSKELPE